MWREGRRAKRVRRIKDFKKQNPRLINFKPKPPKKPNPFENLFVDTTLPVIEKNKVETPPNIPFKILPILTKKNSVVQQEINEYNLLSNTDRVKIGKKEDRNTVKVYGEKYNLDDRQALLFLEYDGMMDGQAFKKLFSKNPKIRDTRIKDDSFRNLLNQRRIENKQRVLDRFREDTKPSPKKSAKEAGKKSLAKIFF